LNSTLSEWSAAHQQKEKAQPLNLRVGLYDVPTLDDEFTWSRYHGQVYTGQSHNRTPVAGARVVAYQHNGASPLIAVCDQGAPQIWGEAITDSNGRYLLFAPIFP
jgi:hypothetical protein